MAKWHLMNDIRLGDQDCDGEVAGPDGAYFDFTDSQNWSPDELRALERLIADANAAEVYRAALEPLALAWSQSMPRNWLEVGLTGEQQLALAEACKLLGIEPRPEKEG